VQIVSGEVEVNGKVLTAGDGAQIANVGTVTINAAAEAEFLLFDLAPVATR
jgi:redox-sensitive bicupin YhaK (pirin superfamily)